MTEKSLDDFGIKDKPEFNKESQVLKEFVGQKLKITNLEFKKLGTYDGVVFTTQDEHKDSEGFEWNKIHTTSSRIRQKLKDVNLDGDVLAVEVVSGKTANGTWYDIK